MRRGGKSVYGRNEDLLVQLVLHVCIPCMCVHAHCTCEHKCTLAYAYMLCMCV